LAGFESTALFIGKQVNVARRILNQGGFWRRL